MCARNMEMKLGQGSMQRKVRKVHSCEGLESRVQSVKVKSLKCRVWTENVVWGGYSVHCTVYSVKYKV